MSVTVEIKVGKRQPCRNGGIMELWNDGFKATKPLCGTVSGLLFPNIPIFHYSNIPILPIFPRQRLHPSGVQSKPAPLEYLSAHQIPRRRNQRPMRRISGLLAHGFPGQSQGFFLGGVISLKSGYLIADTRGKKRSDH